MKKIKFKYWVEDQDEKFYGPGPNELIKCIQREGSLSKAAGEMNMSYKKAWEIVQRLNYHSREPLVILKKGGSQGGGAQVTSYALRIVEEYENLHGKIRELIDQQQKLTQLLN